ncbi:hypothetical protein AVEN_266720-1 [Araneus ventricosus]|uniref:Uncharacterized protein n=1 Tax=Araneus ventricosus TaxID=182803 RepID=A0A4Y2LI45_ARAVE|nr:hypothetical protein AVEN_266720-1 [Araneus ventricosus]
MCLSPTENVPKRAVRSSPSEPGRINLPPRGGNRKNRFYSGLEPYSELQSQNSVDFSQPGFFTFREEPICGVTELRHVLQDTLILHIDRVHNTR